MDDQLEQALREAATQRDEGGVTYSCLSLESIRSLAPRFGLSSHELSAMALDEGFLPLRYVKNIGTMGLEGQARMLRSRVMIAGAGGIGGNAAELLVRAGVGRLALVDPDIFDETNLNRQNFACGDVLGMAKVEVVRDRLLEINHDVEVETHQVAGDKFNLPGLMSGAGVVIDALDSLSDRHVLQEACALSEVVMVHGAIAGSSLQVTTIYPGDPGLTLFAPMTDGGSGKVCGIELETGNPPTTPALAAAIQVQEAVNLIIGRGASLRGRMLYIDTYDWTVEFIDLDEG